MSTNQRVGLKVQYLTSGSHTAAGCALHFFQVVEQGRRAGAGGRPSKRLLVLVDRETFLADVDTASNRCVMISKIESMCMFEEHLRPIAGPLNHYDMLVQLSSMLDFIRTIGSIFKPNDPANPAPMYELEENQPIAARVNCRLSSAAQDDGFSRKQNEDVIRRLRESSSREVSSLREALQRQKDEQLHELIDLHTQNEQLRHTLSQTENLLMESRRNAKEQRVGLLSHGTPHVDTEHGPTGPRSPRAAHSPVGAVTPPSVPYRGGGGRQQQGESLASPAGFRPTSPAPRSAINIYAGGKMGGVTIEDADGMPVHMARSPGAIYSGSKGGYTSPQSPGKWKM
ncbi:hypothetical protein DIPPA_27103 [Diplonema papillatum]|nr:hypothetical protein DIPPA_27103 [Diplonema papillatum]